MTQKEYRDELGKIIKDRENIQQKLQEEINKNSYYEDALQKYYFISEELRKEKEYNRLNCETIQSQREIIERYEKILDKFTINF